MADFQVRSDAIDVEQIMRQIRARIREKRGVDYTEAEVQQLAKVKLEKFLDPRGVRSDLVAEFRKQRVVPPAPPNYEFGENTLFETHRGPLAGLRKLFKPILKLFFNPDRITSALHLQAEINTQGEQRLRRLEEREPIYFELIHNLTIEVTRLGIEVHNLKMRAESLSSRMDFDERRARSLESVVQYRPQPQARPVPSPGPSAPPAGQTAAPGSSAPEGPSGRPDNGGAPDGQQGDRRRRRRRRRRRPGQTFADAQQGRGPDGPGGQPPMHAEPADASHDPGDAGDDHREGDDTDDADSSGQ